jgi:hypothetical protein
MYAAPAEAAEAPDSSAQWLAATLAALLIAPNVVSAFLRAITMTRPDASWMIDSISALAATAYAILSVLVVFLAVLFGRRLTSERRSLLVGASVSAAVAAMIGAGWRFVGPLPPIIWTARGVTLAFLEFAAARAVVRLCPVGFRRALGNVTAILACASVLVAVVTLLGVRIPMAGIADIGAWLGAVIALAAVPRRHAVLIAS